MGNCIRRQAVHPADSLEPTGPQNYEIIVDHNAFFLRPSGTKSVDIKFRYKRLDLLSWLIALQEAQQIIGDGRVVSLVFYAFLQVPSVADMREILHAVRHVRSINIYSGCTGVEDAKRENFDALVKFVQSCDDLQEFRAVVPNDFDWSLLDDEAFRTLRKLEFSAIGDDVAMRPANRRMLEERVVAFCADPDIFYTGEQVTARFLGWGFGTAFIRRLSKAIAESKVNIKVEIQGREKARVRATSGFVRPKKNGGRRRTKTSGGKVSVSVVEDIVTIKRVRGW